MSEPEEAGALLVKLAAAYGSKLSEERSAVYLRALADVPVKQLGRACAQAVRESEFFPTVARLRELALGEGNDEAVLAWVQLRAMAEEVGAYRAVTLSGAAGVALEVVFGGWPEFCAFDDGPALAQRRTEFLAAHRAARRSGSHGTLALPGLTEGTGKLLKEAK